MTDKQAFIKEKRKSFFRKGVAGKFVDIFFANSKVIDEHPHFEKLESLDKLLVELNINSTMADLFSGMVSNGFLFTITDFLTIMTLGHRNTTRQRTVSSQIDLKVFSINKSRIGEKMYVLTTAESFEGSTGHAYSYFYDKNYKLFAKGSQVVFYYPNKKIGEK